MAKCENIRDITYCRGFITELLKEKHDSIKAEYELLEMNGEDGHSIKSKDKRRELESIYNILKLFKDDKEQIIIKPQIPMNDLYSKFGEQFVKDHLNTFIKLFGNFNMEVFEDYLITQSL